MTQCSNYTREVHGFSFRCHDTASVELCFNKDSAPWEPYCAHCFKYYFGQSDISLKRWLVREIGS